jgi:hypothetical protein
MKKHLPWIMIVAVIIGVYFMVYPERLNILTGEEEQLQQTTLYKWQDTDGTWQYTTEPPPGDIPFEQVTYDHNTNVMPLPDALKPRKE